MKNHCVDQTVIMVRKVALLACLCLLTLSSCARKKPQPTEHTENTEHTEDTESLWADVIFSDQQFYIHRYAAAQANDPEKPEEDAEQVISMRYFYRGKRPEVSVIGWDHPKAKEACTGMKQVALDAPMYRGYHYEELQFSFDFSRLNYGETVAVNELTLSIDGKEQTVRTKDRLFLTRMTKEEEEEEKNSKHALELSSDSPVLYGSMNTGLQGSVMTYFSYRVMQDAVIDRLDFDDWYEVKSAQVEVLEEVESAGPGMGIVKTEKVVQFGSAADLFPLSVSEGQRVVMLLLLEPEMGLPFSDYQTRLKLHYHTARDGERILRTPVQAEAPQAYELADEVAVWMDAVIAPLQDASEKTLFCEEFVFDEHMLTDSGENYLGAQEAGKASVRIDFLYQGTLPYIRFEGINGKSEKAGDRITVRRYPILDKPYQDYLIGTLWIEMDPSWFEPGTKTEVETICLSVNGFEKTLDIKKNLVYHRSERGNVHACGSSIVAAAKDVPVFSMDVRDPMIVQKLEILGPLAYENLRIHVGKETVGTDESVFPLALESGQTLEILADFDSNNREMYSRYCFSALVYADVQEENENGEHRTVERIYNCDVQIGNFDPGSKNKVDLKAFMKYALKRKGMEEHL